jgi:hypothetical protein
MSIYSPSAVYDPQFIPKIAAPLIFSGQLGGGAVVPKNFNYLITVARISNNSGAPLPLTLWRVVAGGANTPQSCILNAVLIPLATIQNPAFDLSGVLGTAVLAPGDSIWGYCPQAGALSITADGLEIANP